MIELVKNKSVALVGPAKYMCGSGYGSEIDSHDIVVRINRGIESIKEYSDDIGKKTDIYYSCLIETAQQTGFLDVDELVSRYGIKQIVAPPASDFQGVSRATTFHSMVDQKKMKQIIKRIPIRIIDHHFHTDLAKKVSCKPNTGFLSIYDLLNFDIDRLSIYGFSFYLDGFIPGQKEGVELEKNVSQQGFADLAFNSKRHIQVNMWEYAKRTLKNNPKIKLDAVLEQILNLHTFSRGEFNEEIKNLYCNV